VLASGAPVKAIAVDKSDPYGTALLVRPEAPLRSAAEPQGQAHRHRARVDRAPPGAQGAGPGRADEKDVEFRFLGPVDAKIALANGSVDAWSTWEPYTALAELSGQGRVLVNGRGLSSGNSFLPPPTRRWRSLRVVRRCRTISTAWPQPRCGPTSTWIPTQDLAAIIGFPVEAARLQFERRQLRWQVIDTQTVAEQQDTADFYHAHGLMNQAPRCGPDLCHRFHRAAAAKLAAQPDPETYP
jgi:sulfonate transport system substrate-binding protein